MPPAIPTMATTTSAAPPPVVDGGVVVGVELYPLPPQSRAAAIEATAARYRVQRARARDSTALASQGRPGPTSKRTGNRRPPAGGGRGSWVRAPSEPQVVAVHVTGGELVRRRVWSRGRGVRLVKLDVAARQEAGRDDDGLRHVVRELDPEPVRSLGPGAGLPVVERPHPEVDRAEEVRVGGAADVAIASTINVGHEVPR